MLNSTGCAKLAASSGFDELSVRADYAEKEQSTDSTDTDVGKDDNGQVGE
jgi:hypothetical protein